MTECERIISEGVLPADFLKEEIRSDFRVTTERKKIWAVELDLLLKFDAVCKKEGLQYFLIGGTLLGAIRHKGYIPWDDDVDVVMVRSEYEKLLHLDPQVFAPYFLQTPETDEGYYYSFATLRNSNTSAIPEPFRFQPFNKGIQIDIFPMDNAKLEDLEERFEKIRELTLENSANMRRSNPDPTEEDLRRMEQYPYRDPMKVWREIEAEARRYEHEETEYLNLAVLTLYSAPKLCFPKKCFDKTVYAEFEGFEFPIPYEYDEVLRQQYGDYMIFPPVEKRGTWHSNIYMNPDISYRNINIK